MQQQNTTNCHRPDKAHIRAETLRQYEQMSAEDLAHFANIDPATLSPSELADLKQWLPTLISNLVYDEAEQTCCSGLAAAK